MPAVVLQTDFGFGGGGAMAGVIRTLCPDAFVYDLNHCIEAFNIREAAYSLSCTVPFWPAGTVFVSVVDPGVGTERVSCAAKLKNGSVVVTPDNGTLTMLREDIVSVRRIDERVNRLPGSENVHIFHGRDVYAYTAGKLAAGLISFEEAGEEYPAEEITVLELTSVAAEVRPGFARGGIYNIEASYGCLRINIPNRVFQQTGGFSYGDAVRISVADRDRMVFSGAGIYERTFGCVPAGTPFLCGDIQPGEKQMLRFTINNGSFLDCYAPELKGRADRAKDYAVTVVRENGGRRKPWEA